MPTAYERLVARVMALTFAVVILGLLLTGCTVINMHQEPPVDWPALTVKIMPVSYADTASACQWSLAKTLLIGPISGCAVVNFNDMTCTVYLAADDEYVREHEIAHCQGRDHYGSTASRDLWAEWKLTNGRDGR